MALRMPRPTTRENSSFLQFRCRVPADIAQVARGKLVLVELPAASSEPPVTVSGTAGTFIKFSLRTRDPNVAKVRSAAANTQVNRQFAAWRTGPASLSQRQLVGLSGEVYRLLVEKFEENPGIPKPGQRSRRSIGRPRRGGCSMFRCSTPAAFRLLTMPTPHSARI